MTPYPINKSKAFTLIEIIVVLIILGVLAALALPAYFDWVQTSQNAEALVTLKSLKDQLVPCLRAHQGAEQNCFNNLTCGSNFDCGDNPADSANFHYGRVNNYVTCTSGAGCIDHAPQGWAVMAWRTLPDGSSRKIYVSGNKDDTRTICFKLRTTTSSALWIPDGDC